MTTSSASPELEKYKTTVILKDGSTLYLRPIRPDDEKRLLDLFSRLSPHTIYLRFHHMLKNITVEQVRRFSIVDYENSFAIVGTMGEDIEERIIAVGRFHRLPKGSSAEVALVVEDSYQGRGIGTLLLEHIAVIARDKGISMFEAEILAENQQMMKVLLDSGFQIAQELEYGVYRVVLPVAPTPVVEERSAEREKIATVASLRAFLQPKSVAVVGATQRETAIGNKVFRNLLRQELKGVVYPVNPGAEYVASVRAYPTVLEVPGPIDLAVVVVPAENVQQVIQQCGRKGVNGVVVISAGFAEAGPEGVARQEKLVETARSYGMRLVGPNCMGIINTAPDVCMDTTFSSVFPPAGNVGMCSQSGALGLAILEYAHTLNIGLSTFISIGNRADVSSNDMLQYWEEDPNTDVILLYLESFGNPRKFARIARRVSRTKPIVAVKSGRTPAGSRAAASHTGALATGDIGSEALFAQAGLIRVDTLEELFDVAMLLSHQPVPSGRKVAILTNGGGPGILTADACAVRGLELPTLSENTVSEFRRFLPTGSSTANPVDMTAEASGEQYGRALKLLAQDDGVDVVIAIFVPPMITQAESVADAIRDIAPEFRKRGKTLVASFMGSRGASAELGSEEEGYVPSFTFPEATATALAKACDYADWLGRPEGTIPHLEGIDRDKAMSLIESALSRKTAEPRWLDAPSVSELLRAYGISLVQERPATTAEEAAKAAREIGFPVALKLLSETITHKTEVGGVVLDIHSENEVEKAYNQIRGRLEELGRVHEMQGVLVQQMVGGGTEVIVGVTQDPSFGPLILFGTGGIYTELFRDVTFRIHPLSDADAHDMVRSVKAYKLLEGWRGSPRCDIGALEELLLRISALVEDIPQIAELDLNPVKVLPEGRGYAVVDARILLAEPTLETRVAAG